MLRPVFSELLKFYTADFAVTAVKISGVPESSFLLTQIFKTVKMNLIRKYSTADKSERVCADA